MPHPCRCSNQGWIGSWSAWSSAWHPCLEQGCWNKMLFKIFSKLSYSMILWLILLFGIVWKTLWSSESQVTCFSSYIMSSADLLWKNWSCTQFIFTSPPGPPLPIHSNRPSLLDLLLSCPPMCLPSGRWRGQWGVPGVGGVPEDGDAWIKWNCLNTTMQRVWFIFESASFPHIKLPALFSVVFLFFLDDFLSKDQIMLTLINYSQCECIYTSSYYIRLYCCINPSLLEGQWNGPQSRESSKSFADWYLARTWSKAS